MSILDKTLKNNITNIFIETGTYHGDTSKKAIDFGFKKVYTTELQRHIYQIAKKNLKEEIESNKIELFLDKSADFLRKLLPSIKERATFFLDAHIDYGNYDQEKTPKMNWCPLIEELEIIKLHHIKDHIIIVDDLRLLGKEGWGLEVQVDQIIKKALEINKDYQVIFEEDNIIFKI